MNYYINSNKIFHVMDYGLNSNYYYIYMYNNLYYLIIFVPFYFLNPKPSLTFRAKDRMRDVANGNIKIAYDMIIIERK